MDIFRVRLDCNRFQTLQPTDLRIWEGTTFKMSCKSKMDSWPSPSVYVPDPLDAPGNFFDLCPGGLVVDTFALEKLRDIFEMAGELLPLSCADNSFYLLNVLECWNCLDDSRCKWVLGRSTGAKIRITEYSFYRDRVPESTLFKIPETAGKEILTVSGIKDPDDEFKSLVERQGLSGLIFEKLWSG